MKNTIKFFTALFLALTVMPVKAMSRSDCEALVRNCLTVKSSSTNNNCRETDAKLPGIDSDPTVVEYVKKYRDIVDSSKPEEQRHSENDALTSEYAKTLIEKYCSNYTTPGSDQEKGTTDATEEKSEPTVKSTTNKADEEALKEAERINASTQNLKLGGTVTLPTGTIATHTKVETAIKQWENKCKELVKNAGGAEEDINTQGSTEKTKKQSCFIKTCDENNGYKKEPSIDRMSCKKTDKQNKKGLCDKKKGSWDGVSICYCNGKAITNLSESTPECVKTDTENKSEQKQYDEAIDDIIDAYNSVTKSLIQRCVADGKTLEECKQQ
jgi:hypothetical protein